MTHARPTPGRARLAAVTAGALAAAGLGVLGAAPASAAPATVDDVMLQWGLNAESGSGAYFGGCNFLSAGTAGDTGSSRLWTEADGFYSAQEGAVTVLKPTAAGGWEQPTWATRCQDASGATVNTSGRVSGNVVELTGGAGTVDAAAGTASISWDGSFSVVYYGGLTYWTASDPVLTVDADGTATLEATASGYGTSMEDMSIWEPIEPRTIPLAELTGVTVDEDGFTGTPEYLGVEVEASGSPQSRTGASWGSFPQEFVDFQVLSGQTSYWYSSGGAADVRKPTTPLAVAWSTGSAEPEPEPEPGGDGDIDIEVEVPEQPGGPGEPGEPGEPGALEWSIAGDASVNLGQATTLSDGRFFAEGTLPIVTVTDTREGAPAWELTGLATDFTAGSAGFGAEYLGWSPQVLTNQAAAYPGSSTSGTGGLASAARLAVGLQGHDAGPATVTALLDLVAPARTEPGSYTSTITLTMVG